MPYAHMDRLGPHPTVQSALEAEHWQIEVIRPYRLHRNPLKNQSKVGGNGKTVSQKAVVGAASSIVNGSYLSIWTLPQTAAPE